MTANYTPTFMEKLLGRNYKWWILFVNNLKSDTTYFAQNFFYIFSTVFKNLIFILVWYVNFISGSSVLSLQEIVQYFLIGALLTAFLYSDSSAWLLAGKIGNGSLSSLLLTPSSLFKWMFFRDLGRSFLQILVQVTLTLILLFGANKFFPFEINFISILVFAIFLVIGRVIQFLIDVLQGCAAFWFTEIWGITSITSNVWTLSSGETIPLEILTLFFPFFGFLFFFPFPFLFYYPTQIYLGKYDTTQTLVVFAGGITWCIILYFLAKLVFKLGLKRNESVGL